MAFTLNEGAKLGHFSELVSEQSPLGGFNA